MMEYFHIEPVRRPTADELATCTRIAITPEHDWDPHSFDGYFASLKSHFSLTDDQTIEDDATVGNMLHSTLAHDLYYNINMFQQDDESYASFFAMKTKSKDTLTPEALSKLWKIGLSTVKRTLQATTHKCIWTTGLLAKRLRTDRQQLRYKQLNKSYGRFYTDYLKSKAKSIRGFIGGTIFTNKLGFIRFYPCLDEKGTTTASTLKEFVKFVGLPSSLHSDNHSNFKEGAFKSLVRKLSIPQTFTEPHSPWQNRAEFAIGELARYSRQLMQSTQTPLRLWCFCFEYAATIISLCATGRYELKGRTSYEIVTNYTPDISEFVSFGWYQWCWYFDEDTRSKRLCRWLGPAQHIGQSFCSYILLDNSEFIARSLVIPITNDELEDNATKEQMQKFTDAVEAKIGNHRLPIFQESDPQSVYSNTFIHHDSTEFWDLPYGHEFRDAIPEEVDSAYLDSLDEYINTKVVIIPGVTDGIEPVLATIKRRKRDAAGNLIGEAHSNPILDTRVYQLEFLDGRIEEYSMNTIAENLYAQVDSEGYDTGIFSEVIDYRCDEEVAIPQGEHAFTSLNGRETPVITTKGWDLLIRWKDQSSNWVPLAHVKESHPVEVAEFAVAHNLQHEPAFRWWVPHVLRKRTRIVKRVKTRAERKGNMKFGVIVPTTVAEALELDRINGNTLWHDAIEKEMKNNRIAFDLLPRDSSAPVGYKKITCHMNFEVKMDLRRKARYVAGGHLTDPPTSMTYSTVVSRESVRIAFLVAALNGLDILAGDIQNAYLNADTTEKLYFIAGDEWKADRGRIVVIKRALYGLKSSALAWRNHLADVLNNKLGFQTSLADPDVWFKPATKPNGEKYYSYILVTKPT